MGKYFVESDLLRLQKKGLKIIDPIMKQKLGKAFGIPKKKSYNGKEKTFIEDVLNKTGLKIEKELRFHLTRKFRFDWAIPSLMIGCEYDGLISAKSRHTTISGFSKDLEKMNLAVINGWKVLRYSALNYQNIESDIQSLIKNTFSK